METELEKLVVRLTGDGMQYANMLSQAEKQTKSSMANIQGSMRGALGLTGGAGGALMGPISGMVGAGGQVTGVIGSLFSSFMGLAAAGGPVTMLAVGVAGVSAGLIGLGAAGVGALAFLSHLGTQGAHSVMELKHLAAQIGVTTEAAAALSLGGENLGHSLFHMQHATAAISGEAHGAAAALDKLHIDAQAFAQANTEQQLRMVAAGFQNLATQGEKATVARALFGRGGHEMIELLSRGTAGLDAQAARAERFGLTVSSAEASMVRSSLKSWNQWSDAWEGIKRQLAVGFAPIWESLGNVGGKIGETLVTVVREWIPVFHSVWSLLQTVGTVGVSAFVAIKDAILNSLGLGSTKFVDFRNLVLTVVVAIEYGIKNWKPVMNWVLDEFKLGWMRFKMFALESVNTIASNMRSLLPNFLQDAARNVANWPAWAQTMIGFVPGGAALVGVGHLLNATELDSTIADLRDQVEAFANTVAQERGNIADDINRMVQERLDAFEKLRARSDEIAGGGGGGAGKLKTVSGTEATLANSERAFTILFSNRESQDAMMRAQTDYQQRAAERLQTIEDLLRDAPVMRSAG